MSAAAIRPEKEQMTLKLIVVYAPFKPAVLREVPQLCTGFAFVADADRAIKLVAAEWQRVYGCEPMAQPTTQIYEVSRDLVIVTPNSRRPSNQLVALRSYPGISEPVDMCYLFQARVHPPAGVGANFRWDRLASGLVLTDDRRAGQDRMVLTWIGEYDALPLGGVITSEGFSISEGQVILAPNSRANPSVTSLLSAPASAGRR